MSHRVSSLVDDAVDSDSASWSMQMDDGGYIYAEENQGIAVYETPSDIWWKI